MTMTGRNITRRQALLSGAAAAATLPLLSRTAHAAADLDIAIIGGGISGLYAALRLAAARPTQTVRLFEMGTHLGGRLHSFAFPQSSGLIGEMGAARFTQAHTHVTGLARTLDLVARPMPLDLPQARLSLRGRNIPFDHAGVDPLDYAIAPADQALSGHTLRSVLAGIIAHDTIPTPEVWAKQRLSIQVQGKALAQWQSTDLLSSARSPALRDFLRDTARIDAAGLQGNALALGDFLFGDAQAEGPFFTLAGGFQGLPRAIAAKLAGLGVAISTGERLVSLAIPGSKNGPFSLAFAGANGRRSQISAKTVILALPSAGLEAIPDFSAHSALALSRVTPVASAKALLLYKSPWWSDLAIPGGRSLTDSPARQFVARGAEPQRLAAEASGGFGLLETLSEAKDAETLRALATPAPADSAGFSLHAPDSPLAASLHQQACQTYGVPAPAPLAVAFQDWSVAPFGGGLSAWAKGADPHSIAPTTLQPLKGRALYVTGDTWSTRQNTVEGALEQTEALLQHHFNLNAPPWGGI